MFTAGGLKWILRLAVKGRSRKGKDKQFPAAYLKNQAKMSAEYPPILYSFSINSTDNIPDIFEVFGKPRCKIERLVGSLLSKIMFLCEVFEFYHI